MKELTSAQIEARRRARSLRMKAVIGNTYLWLLLVLLYAPIVLIIVFSFTKSKVFGNWTGFTVQLYENLFTGYDSTAQVRVDPNLYRAVAYTGLIALIAATVSTILGTLAAIGIFNMRAKQRRAIQLLNSVPMINPDILTGISLFLLFVFLGISRGLVSQADQDESEHLRGSARLGRYAFPGFAQSAYSGTEAGYGQWFYPGADAEY